ncbi:hypothetical protein LPU83_pLPU83c_0489 (plasmid) [Rhizobium favelukesii]|uniref:Uncharacterized protein n=2 Tax=Rhizobium favelukesii TaxID=348824 RepID=W6S400_9HYPH|nr:hypothetical protein LPU83_pLPU83c_0489 [Rhizobium favelukesii]
MRYRSVIASEADIQRLRKIRQSHGEASRTGPSLGSQLRDLCAGTKAISEGGKQAGAALWGQIFRRNFGLINANVQDEAADSYNPELAGQLAVIGIVKSKEFKPDDRLKKILTDAAAVGNAASRALSWLFSEPHPDWLYYPGSMWGNMLREGGANLETPPPMITKEGLFAPLPPTGARTLASKTAYSWHTRLNSWIGGDS